ncbi:MAG: trypsin-like peptidase domain-containing protein [Kiritimatiellae bacterium]|nr:trypsin-like peptidase domain-containing protein [Kiritimatiellia bacterium]
MRRWLQLVVMVGALAARTWAAGPGLAKQLSREIADTVAKVMPSVVVVRTEATRYLRAYDLFFGRRLMIPQILSGQGSGMIIDREGHVLTSRHVVAGAEDITVVLNDQTELNAKIVGMDATTDLALLKVEPPPGRGLTPIEFGDSDALRVGEIVIAIGSPFSLAGSVTMGVVSQKGRTVGVLPFEDFIQTDAPINPGNSGGPLVDLDGRMVGVNAVIQTSGASQGNIGIGFAVPVNLARRVAESLRRTGRFERPWLGIAWDEIETPPEPGQPRGLRVAAVFRNTPAARAGLRPGDVILRIAGQPVASSHDLLRALLSQPVGTPLELEVRRGRHTLRVAVTTARMPDQLTDDDLE